MSEIPRFALGWQKACHFERSEKSRNLLFSGVTELLFMFMIVGESISNGGEPIRHTKAPPLADIVVVMAFLMGRLFDGGESFLHLFPQG
uniref:Uncharacterized protein n=1 Tax=Candidatus Kentrum sp. MB TaxID=2138164 RepID=A0A450XM24_9GAMM|nr:MAG: hypothetical protein BECKMB1821G_GA0114241_102146 [Candidatus Kentron sp. MB]VFK30324.1 MAG: hypothetical protein BECKMB1821I_GA0114274_10152 [Candidatus Kentron sp. MB]VFK75170.1 MAG: hypothetical protein BECKMB1821H_GA0114242_10172 [Candidatus Kentron sp. MB]